MLTQLNVLEIRSVNGGGGSTSSGGERGQCTHGVASTVVRNEDVIVGVARHDVGADAGIGENSADCGCQAYGIEAEWTCKVIQAATKS